MKADKRIGLSLSGGGYRAAAFHLGTLKKLYELGVLGMVDVISTISGGSITGAYYSLNGADFELFYKSLYEQLHTGNVIKKVLLSFTTLKTLAFLLLFLVPAGYLLGHCHGYYAILLLVFMIVLLFRFQFQIFPVSSEIEKAYNEFFFKGKELQSLSEKPLLIIGSTNLDTARPFTFSKKLMQDTDYSFRRFPVLFKPEHFPIARAVMASSCVPFAFTPVKIDKVFFADPNQYEDVSPVLVDGGVYDNQGAHKIMHSSSFSCHTVIVSDAGGGGKEKMNFRNTISLLVTVVNVFMARIKKAQMVENIYENTRYYNKEIAYISLAWDVEKAIDGFIRNLKQKQVTASVISAHGLEASWVATPDLYEKEIRERLEYNIGYDTILKPDKANKVIAREVGTNLTSLSAQKLNALIQQAEALTEVQVKLYCPSIFEN